MKKKQIVLLVVCAAAGTVNANDVTSKTFFSTHGHFHTGSPERETLWRDEFLLNTNNSDSFEVVPYVSSTMNSDKIARYFLPFGKSEILVAEDNAPQAAQRDVNAIHLNINHDPAGSGNTFQSRVKFKFRQTVAGIGIAVRHEFCPKRCGTWWFAASAPLEIVVNTVKLEEHIENNGGVLEETRVPNVTVAFQQPTWRYGRVDGNPHSKIGVADIEFQLGYKWGRADKGHFDIYVGGVFPTGNRPNPCLLFAPVVGNNKHWGALWGATFAKTLHCTVDSLIVAVLSANSRYLASNHQKRSFDLMDKQWGRYMEVYANKQAAEVALAAPSVAAGDHGSPGINVFTQKMKVHPGFAYIMNAAFIGKKRGLQAEVGYNLYARQAEKVSLACCWQPIPALVSATQGGSTTKSRTINRDAAGSDDVDLPNYTALDAGNLDIASAAHPAVVSHLVYGSFGYQCQEEDHDLEPYLSLGWSYDFSSNNASLDRWTAWGKIGFDY